MQQFLWIILSSAIVYLFVVIAIRLFGKKELAQLSVTDLVFILLISNAVQNAMVRGNDSLEGGIAAALTLFLVNYLFKHAIYKFPKFGKLVQGEAIMLIYHGKLLMRNMARAKISRDELEEAAREHGVHGLEEVDLAVLEIDGNISILSDEFKNVTKKRKKYYRNVV